MAQPQHTFVDTPEAVASLLSLVPKETTSIPSIYIDLEGANLGRHGSISLLQLFISIIPHIYILDIHTLGQSAFTTPSLINPLTTLKTVLEDPSIPIVCYDIRSDSDALYHLYSVYISNVVDLQLYEVATRTGPRTLLNSLSQTIKTHSNFSLLEARKWEQTKQRGAQLFTPEKGGSFEIFNDRPLPKEILDYCVQNVQQLPWLWQYFRRKLEKMDERWKALIETETQARIALCREDYVAEGRQRALAPLSFRNFPSHVTKNP
ncbi:hypothetical protein TWF225_010684 [Orbilia oligospora]|nr:hypothetical protein TWF225_010684 [Orbilia oligospora]KAF3240639.1 hypothetical protein TWF128_011254 [Orbilia oligospora]KAF3243660.1 hypothetical protein TWF217_011169 [Orbilia oligospora]KAF3281841.1 hypothetical protein TWF132_011063 [Orbilia oligospora]